MLKHCVLTCATLSAEQLQIATKLELEGMGCIVTGVASNHMLSGVYIG